MKVSIIKKGVRFQCHLRLLNEGTSQAVPWRDASDIGVERMPQEPGGEEGLNLNSGGLRNPNRFLQTGDLALVPGGCFKPCAQSKSQFPQSLSKDKDLTLRCTSEAV